MKSIIALWNTIQSTLFPFLEEILDPLTEKQRQFVSIIELINPEPFMKQFSWIGNGRKPKKRLNLLKAFIAKAVYNFTTTEILVEYLKSCKNLRRLCGWETILEIPSLSTFSRAFDQFAKSGVLQEIHAAMVTIAYDGKLVGHVSRDSSAIEAREKPEIKEPKPPRAPKKRGRRKKGEEPPPVDPKRLEIQPNRSLETNLADLPQACNIGAKKNSKGHQESWIGYKLHADVVEGDIPVSLILTSASVHDSQAAIPLAQMTAGRVTSLYDLMDAAYDAKAIHQFIKSQGHVPLIDSNPRAGEKIQMGPPEKTRYKQRTSVERMFSMLKDNHGGRNVRVRGPKKVMTHLMFGILVITATQLFRLVV